MYIKDYNIERDLFSNNQRSGSGRRAYLSNG